MDRSGATGADNPNNPPTKTPNTTTNRPPGKLPRHHPGPVAYLLHHLISCFWSIFRKCGLVHEDWTDFLFIGHIFQPSANLRDAATRSAYVLRRGEELGTKFSVGADSMLELTLGWVGQSLAWTVAVLTMLWHGAARSREVSTNLFGVSGDGGLFVNNSGQSLPFWFVWLCCFVLFYAVRHPMVTFLLVGVCADLGVRRDNDTGVGGFWQRFFIRNVIFDCFHTRKNAM